MAYPVTLLISEAFYTSGIVSRNFQTVAGDQEQTGFLKLNEILSDTAIEEDMIPYFTTSYDFNAVPGQEMYFIPNLSDPETLTFFINTIRYQMRKESQDLYFGAARAENVESLPYNWHCERCLGGCNLFIYFFPDTAYPMQLTGRFRLQTVTINQDLSLILDQYYINYLQYRLADRLCTAYNFAPSPSLTKQLLQYQQMISKRSSPMDLRINKISTLTPSQSINYAQINLGHGWTTD